MSQEPTRLAVVDRKRCSTSKCANECIKNCPLNRAQRKCIEMKKPDPDSKETKPIPIIHEAMCIGCGACVLKCPHDALKIINLPFSLKEETVHRYDRNGFKLHRLPHPRPNQVLGLVGSNGTGKSTAIQILSKKFVPNLGIIERADASGKTDDKAKKGWDAVIQKFRGSELQKYLNLLVQDELTVVVKPQHVEIPKSMTVGNTIRARFENHRAKDPEYFDKRFKRVVDELELNDILDRDITVLSGGEVQRVMIAIVSLRKANTFFFDEPSSYLDVSQRMRSARVIRDTISNGEGNYCIVIEHDLALLDYVSDYVSLLYGSPGAYGVISHPINVREGINQFLDGFIPSENIRFRDDKLVVKIVDEQDYITDTTTKPFEYSSIKSYQIGDFKFTADAGSFRRSSCICLLGQNGVGKTTFISLLSREFQPKDDGKTPEYKLERGENGSKVELSVSFKPQTLNPKFGGRVIDLLNTKISASIANPTFREQVYTPLQLDHLQQRRVKDLSGGELQRLAICLALGVNAELYLIDEPSAFLDAEQRVRVAKIIKRYIMNAGKTAFIVEHDFIMATYLADNVIVFTGRPGIETHASAPMGMKEGLNVFLKEMNITIRSEKETGRPRINQYNSQKEKEQMRSGTYYVPKD